MVAGFNLNTYKDIRESRDHTLPQPCFNFRPGKAIPALVWQSHGLRCLVGKTWGYKPTWKKEADLITMARIETAGSKPTFSVAMEKRRVAIPMVGYFLHSPSKDFAPLYRYTMGSPHEPDVRWVGGLLVGPNQDVVVLTTEDPRPDRLSNKYEWKHRIPAFLDYHFVNEWIDPSRSMPHEVFPILTGKQEANLCKYVSPRANDGDTTEAAIALASHEQLTATFKARGKPRITQVKPTEEPW